MLDFFTPEIQDVALNALYVGLMGMVGIFVFMTLFYLLILALNRFLPGRDESAS